jgi:hypothetical protein
VPEPLVRLLRALLVVPLAVAGAAAGLLGSFVHPLTVSVLPLGLLLGGGLTAGVVVTAGLVADRPGAVAAALGWMAAVLVLASRRPEGDLVVPASGPGYTWLLGGTVLAIGCASLPYRRYRGFSAPTPTPITPEWTRR